MHFGVVVAAQREEVVDVGEAAFLPFDQVVDLTVRKGHVAEAATVVDRSEGVALGVGCGPVGAADLER